MLVTSADLVILSQVRRVVETMSNRLATQQQGIEWSRVYINQVNFPHAARLYLIGSELLRLIFEDKTLRITAELTFQRGYITVMASPHCRERNVTPSP